MEIMSEPFNIKVNSEDTICPCCNSLLQKEIRDGEYLIGDECRYCRYLDRPFGGCGNTALSHYGGCECVYGNKDYLYISCQKCLYPTCVKCEDKCKCIGNGCNNIVCKKCIEKTTFNNKWNTSTLQEKLYMYGIKKLQLLAKNKKIKGFSKYKKSELICILIPVINEKDFPIK
jgi:hypothetical protein